MKTLVRTITIVVIAFNLSIVGFVSAQNTSDEETLSAQREAEIAKIKAEAETAAKAAAETGRRKAEIAQMQMESSQRQAEAAKQQVEESLRAVAIARQDQSVPAPPVVPSPGRLPLETILSSRNRRLSTTWPRSGGAGTALVIPSEQIKTEDLVAINEDMRVMSAILTKNLRQANIIPSGGSLFTSIRDPFTGLLGSSTGAIQSIYLQGYGALFMMNVDFPLSPPPEIEQEDKVEEKATLDQVWDQVRRDLYEPEAARKRKNDRPVAEYDAEKVENLKKTVIRSLQHAANIRNLDLDESVVVTIIGSGSSVENITSTVTQTGQVVIHDKNTNTIRLVEAPQPADLGLLAPTVLTIRVKKSDIGMGFGGRDFDLDQFRKSVQILSYPILGEAVSSGSALDATRDALNTLRYDSMTLR